MKSNTNNYFFIIMIVVAFISLNGCSLIDPASPTPCYVKIDSIQLLTDYATQGSSANKITDAWVLVDGVYLGTFPLPCKFPIAGTGQHEIKIKGGIIEDGIAGMRAAYPKYSSYDTTFILQAAQIYTIHPRVNYESFTTFPNMEDFDDASLNLVTTTQGNTPITIISPPDPNVFEGNSGKVTLVDTNIVFEVAANSPFYLPINTLTFVELNYKSDIDFVVGVYITSSSVIKQELLSIRASSTWKKIYININDLGGVISNGIAYKVYLRAEKPSTVISANLYFDNFKVVY